MGLEDFINKFASHFAVLIAGTIFAAGRKMIKDVNASFDKIRDLEERIEKLELNKGSENE